MRTGKRNIYPDERRQWLEQYETGKSLSVISRDTGRNYRTIKQHVERAADERERSLARTDLYRQSITQHNEDLLRILGYLRNSLMVPPHDRFTAIAHFGQNIAPELASTHLEFQDDQWRVYSVGRNQDDIRLLELAREHLTRDRQLWNDLDSWVNMVQDYAQECYQLGLHAGEMIVEKVDLGFIPSGRNTEGIHEGILHQACSLAIDQASGTQTPADAEDIKISETQLRYGGSLIATSSSRDKLETISSLFLEVTNLLSNDQRVIKIIGLRGQLRREAERLSRTIGDILLLRLVPGRCTVCQRLR